MEKIGPYLIRGYITSGGMAEIYRGYRDGPHGFTKDVVIKAIHPHLLKDERYVRLFLKEAKIWARLNHSNIVQIYEFFEWKGRYYLVMEYVKGADLVRVTRRSKEKGMSLGIPRALKIVMSVLSALDYAHNFKDEVKNINGVIHRDISPQNILISINGDVKITDFGIAKVSVSSGITTYGTIVGKIDYMSREQALGQEVDLTTDIFSTGVVLWEMLTDNKLFFADSDVELLKKVKRCEIVRPSLLNPEIDEELEQIIMRALSKERRMRYQRATDFSNDLASYLIKYPHSVSDENIADFMKELFPEFSEEHYHKTEVLNDGFEQSDKKGGRSKAMIIFLSVFLPMLIVFGVLFYPRHQSPIFKRGKGIKTETLQLDYADLQSVSSNSNPNNHLAVEKEERKDGEATTPTKEEKDTREHQIPLGSLKNSSIKSEKTRPTHSRKNGYLSVNAIPWADIYIGKKKIGTTPIFNYELKSGRVEVVFKNDAIGVERKRTVWIKPDVENRFTEDLTK